VTVERPQIRQWLIEEFVSRLGTVFETMAGTRPEIGWEPLQKSPAPDGANQAVGLRWRQPFSNVPGAVWTEAPNPDWSGIGNFVLQAAGIEESDAESLKSTFLETIGQALSGLGQAISSRLDREAVCESGEQTAAEPGEALWAVVKLALPAGPVSLLVGMDAALLDAFGSPLSEASAENAKSAKPLASGVAAFGSSKTFDLLLEVELPVSVSFGRAQVPLRDVLKLTTGSIVELNRSIAEPVEVIVNNCVIARGEVVVVEGNFGVRIQQVISRQERLRTLM